MTETQPMSLARYVPAHTLRRIARDPRPLSAVTIDRLDGAVLFADISGFTSLTERTASGGGRAASGGAEAIRDCLDAYFGSLAACVAELGGDVVKFAGDALIAMWPASDLGLADATAYAVFCASTIQERFGNWPVPAHIFESVGGARAEERLTVRICVCAGELTITQLGGVLGRWESLVLGVPLQRLAELKRLTEPGQVLVSSAAAALLGPGLRGLPRSGGHVLLTGPIAPLPPRSSPRVVADLDHVPAEAMEAALRSYLPSVVLTRLAASHAQWVGELRRVSVVFVALPAAEDASEDGIARAQALVAAIQSIIYQFDGSINKVSIDEKGAVLLAAFGLPPLSHEDDSARAIHAANRIRDELERRKEPVHIGVATGTVFCGAVGSPDRAEYTIIGTAANLAARLMEKSDGEVLSDEATYESARSQLGFEPRPPLAMKGLPGPIRVYVPTGEFRLVARPRTSMVGRLAERGVLSDAIQSVLRSRESAGVILIGEAGIGKSRLVDEAVEQARRQGASVLNGGGDSIDQSTPYRAWRPIFARLFAIEDLGPEARAARVKRWLADDEQALELAPLLDAVLPLPIPDTALTRAMVGEARANKTQELLCRILDRAGSEGPTLIVLEDGHWFDTQSWALLVRVAREVPHLAIVVASRPFGSASPTQFTELLALPTTRTVRLEGLSFEDTRTLLQQRLVVREVSDEVAALVFDRGAGNALFTEELALALRDLGRITVDGDVARLAAASSDLAGDTLPTTIQGVVTARVDRLSADVQLILKVASVIGRTFEVSLLADVCAQAGGTDHAVALLESLVELDLIRPLAPSEGESTAGAEAGSSGPSDRYLFKHALTQDAIYALMLVAQRKDLHRMVARWYEGRDRADDPTAWSPLAHHWERAQDFTRAVHYLELAGAQALEGFANRECIRAFETALAIGPADILGDDPRVGGWHRLLAEAQFRVGNLGACRDHGQRALTSLGRHLPRGVLGQVLGLFGQIGLRVIQRWWPSRFAARTETERAERLAATRVLNRITEVCIYSEDALGCLDSGLRELNTSEPAGASPELGRAYAAMSIVLGTVPLHRVCRAWTERAIVVAEKAGVPSAIAYVLSRVAVYDLYIARWDDGERRLRRAMATAERIGDSRLREEAMAILAKTLFYSGRFRESTELWADVRSSSRKSGSGQTSTWSLFGQAEGLLRLGLPEVARPMLDASREWTASAGMASEVVWLEGLRALALLRTGAAKDALDVAMAILPKVAGVRPVAYWTQQSTAALAEVLLELGRRGDATARAAAPKAVGAVTAFAKTFPFGGAHAALWTGVLHVMQGNHVAATRAFDRCVTLSVRLGTPYEGARASLEAARLLPEGADRRRAIGAAAERLDALGAGWEVADRDG